MTKKIKEPVKKLLTTAIEWVRNSDGTAGYAINLWIGCSKISPACDNCYAEISRVSTCLGVKWGDDKPRHKCNPCKKLAAINNKAAKQGIRIRVFINPDSDIFDNKAPQEWRDEFWSFVWSTPSIDYILVTKRIGNAKRMIPQSWLDNGYPANVWQLITVCNQAEADRDITKLLELNAVVRGLSIEPMLGEIDIDAAMYGHDENKRGLSCFGFTDGFGYEACLQWVVLGGESGKNARPMNPHWARKIRDQCVDAGVPFFFKQWGEWVDAINGDLTIFQIENLERDAFGSPKGANFVYKVGKKRAGNILDGQVWQQMPEAKNAPKHD